ncbi:MAG TPA: helix-turn-helix domain-containing protein [Steroidobacteraceae bacterium]|nr:helix-turn-helix domain-containing protein [Steroidobacteraceae bacterium]
MTARIVKSAERTILVFEFFARIRRPASTSEIVDALQIPQSSASALLRSLQELGYLEWLRGVRKFRPTLRVTLLGDWLKPELPADTLTERLDSLQARTHETVVLGRQQGCQIQYVYILRPRLGSQFNVQGGTTRPMTMSASGRALLSVLSEEMMRRIVRRNIAEERLRVSEDRVIESIREFRRMGFAETDSAISGPRDVHAIATLIPNKAGTELISLAVAGPRERMLQRRPELKQMLHDYLDHE